MADSGDPVLVVHLASNGFDTSAPKRFELKADQGEQVLKVGRSTDLNEVVLEPPGISWKHCELKMIGPPAGGEGGASSSRVVVKDLSKNGTGIMVPGGSVVRLQKDVETPVPDGSIIILPIRVKRKEDASPEQLRACFVVHFGELPDGGLSAPPLPDVDGAPTPAPVVQQTPASQPTKKGEAATAAEKELWRRRCAEALVRVFCPSDGDDVEAKSEDGAEKTGAAVAVPSQAAADQPGGGPAAELTLDSFLGQAASSAPVDGGRSVCGRNDPYPYVTQYFARQRRLTYESLSRNYAGAGEYTDDGHPERAAMRNRCAICVETGHEARDCPRARCGVCFEEGHDAAECGHALEKDKIVAQISACWNQALAAAANEDEDLRCLPWPATFVEEPPAPQEMEQEASAAADEEAVAGSPKHRTCKTSDGRSRPGFAVPQHRDLPPPTRSSLTRGASRSDRPARRSVSFQEMDALVRVVEIVNHREVDLWFSNAGQQIVCNGCGEEFEQASGRLQGEGGRSQFSQTEFVCFPCLQTERVLESEYE